MPLELSHQRFYEMKREILDCNDVNLKGCSDSNISGLISLINGYADMVTMRSCSGRVVIVSKDGLGYSKGRCHFIFVTHERVAEDEVFKSLCGIEGNLTIKFEPFILHVKCRVLNNAMELLKCAIDAGYRNSGITLGRRGNITVAIRSTLNLEAPISSDGQLIVPNNYLKYLIWLANEKLELNQTQTAKFHNIVKSTIDCWAKPENHHTEWYFHGNTRGLRSWSNKTNLRSQSPACSSHQLEQREPSVERKIKTVWRRQSESNRPNAVDQQKLKGFSRQRFHQSSYPHEDDKRPWNTRLSSGKNFRKDCEVDVGGEEDDISSSSGSYSTDEEGPSPSKSSSRFSLSGKRQQRKSEDDSSTRKDRIFADN